MDTKAISLLKSVNKNECNTLLNIPALLNVLQFGAGLAAYDFTLGYLTISSGQP